MAKIKPPQTASSRASGCPSGQHGGIELLLIQAVDHVGKQGDVVEVKRGYAKNYLLPQGLATIATDHHKRMVEKHKARLQEIQNARLAGLRNAGRRTGASKASRSKPTPTTKGICTARSAPPKSSTR